MRDVLTVTLSAVVLALFVSAGGSVHAQGSDPEFYPLPCTNTITANVVAMDQSLHYNRFGAFDPHGMIYALERTVEPEIGLTLAPGNVRLKSNIRPRPLTLRVHEGDCIQITLTNLLDPSLIQNVGTRSVSMNVSGLDLAEGSMIGTAAGNNPNPALAPGQTSTFTWYAPERGSYHIGSLVSSTGGEGDNGSQAHGLFGAIVVEPAGSTWYRSQVDETALDAATIGTNPNGTPQIDYNAVYPDGTPVLRMLDDSGELIYSDLNAIIADNESLNCTNAPPSGTCGEAYREFTVIFHDEIGIRQAYPELKNDNLFHGVRDGFAINYGSGGLGAVVMAVRRGEGPGKDCGECKFEEFFLESWVNGDPAMPVDRDPITGEVLRASYSEDPSNVHHSYIGDPVRFENLHVGAETHVFHLHAHQWLYAPDDENSTYLDSQSISPGTSYSYEINYGGGGNRNLMPGDSIFHCHLYPHFAQGMWELWRSHDVFENGHSSRNLPDAEIAGGTPNPAIVPIPGRAMPPMPSPSFEGYPFYIAGQTGRRTPQPPLDIDHDGGLPRNMIINSTWTDGAAAIAPHYLTDPVAQRVTANNPSPHLLGFARRIDTAEMVLLPHDGTPEEKAAMDFHAGLLNPDPALGPATPITTEHHWPAVGYPSFDSAGNPGFFLVNGLPPQPGAPYSDPCPPTFIDGSGVLRNTPTRTYDAAYVQFDMTINQYGWHDRQARIAVLAQDVTSTLDGTRSPQPLFFRANSGDCVVYKATNLMPGNLNVDDYQIFTPTDIIGQHIHLVKFDVTSSDGAGNGWNYEDGTFSPEEVRERIHANNLHVDPDGDGNPDNPGTLLTPEVHPFYGAGPNNDWVGAQTTIQRWWADPVVNNAGEDRTVRSVFTHDHFGPSSHQQHGLYALLVVEPTGSIWTMPNGQTQMGTRSDGGPTNWAANIISGFGGSESVREFVFETGDFMPTYDLADLPVAAPGIINNPEAISTSGGSETINYRNDPISHVLDNSMATAFSSVVNSDPHTFVGKAYPGDPIKISLAHGAQEGQHAFGMHGARWLQEPSNTNSGYTNQQQYGISEHFEMYFTLGDGLKHTTGPTGFTDYLTGSLSTYDLRGGMYGLIRSYGTPQSDLAALPNNANWTTRPQHPLSLGICPNGPGAPPKRSFALEAWRVGDLNNNLGLHVSDRFGFRDPNALVFLHADEVQDVISGAREIEPLTLRVNAGDCIEVTLKNNLPPTLPLFLGANTGSSRVSLHPQLLSYDMGTSDGAAIGRNPDSTVAPGDTRQFAWYAGEIHGEPGGQITWTPMEFGVTNLRSFGDFNGHATHGLYGVCIVEPEGSTHVDPITGGPARSAQADIYDANGDLLFREFSIQWMEDMPQVTRANGQLMPLDTLRNFEGFNYKSEPIWARMGVLNPDPWVQMRGIDQTWSLSSTHPLVGCGGLPCGDPETPLFEANAGTPVMWRVAQAGMGTSEPRSFKVSGHGFQQQPWTDDSTKIGDNPTSRTIGVLGNITTGSHDNLLMVAGGAARAAGDYVYRSATSFAYSGGAWGIFRVHPYERIPAAQVVGLACAGTTSGVDLSWTNGGDDYLAIEISRDGQLVANLDGTSTSWSDPSLPPGEYQYSIVTVNIDLPSQPVLCNSQVTPLGVTNVTCDATGGLVTLNWTVPPEVAGYDSIDLTRNGVPVASVSATTTTFQDLGAGFGVHDYAIVCRVSGIDSEPALCSTVITPPPVGSISATIVDPCLGGLLATWTSAVAFDSIDVTLDGAPFATLPGTATEVQFPVAPGGSRILCVTGTASGLTSDATCAALTAPTVEPTAVLGLTCVTDETTLQADLSWANTDLYSAITVSIDGTLFTTLPGNATSTTIPVDYGVQQIEIRGSTVCGETLAPASCSTSIAPPSIDSLTSAIADPCACTISASWGLGATYDSVTVSFEGSPVAVLPGSTTLFPYTLPQASGQLCVIGTIGGLDSAPVCMAVSCTPIATTGVEDLTVLVDEANFQANVSWTNTSDYGSLEVTIDGTSVASLTGGATSATVSLLAGGAFDLCVSGATVCGDPIQPICTTGVAPVTFQRGDSNADTLLDIADVTSSIGVIFLGDSHLCYDALDANDDGGIDVSDPVTVLLYLFGSGSPPAGSATCSPDLTVDLLDCATSLICP